MCPKLHFQTSRYKRAKWDQTGSFLSSTQNTGSDITNLNTSSDKGPNIASSYSTSQVLDKLEDVETNIFMTT